MAGIREFIRSLIGAGAAPPIVRPAGATPHTVTGSEDRAYWLSVLTRLASPVLGNLAQHRLKDTMPIESFGGSAAERRTYSHLEAFGRLLAGVSPWLEVTLRPSAERELQTQYGDLARRALGAATDPDSSDFMNFTSGKQPLVDAAYLAHAIIRAPDALWGQLEPQTRANVVAALRSTRIIKPPFNNWLLFGAMIEAAFCLVGEPWDAMRVDYAVRQHEQWYEGDGMYGDGPTFRWDYYNSLVIQPFPPIGRSLAYRFGAFQLLAQMALLRQLPQKVAPAQVRCALTTVIRRMIEAPGTFDAAGWLRIGFSGHQPRLGERYISTGSLYLCAVGLLPLGLPPEDEFWTAAPEDWTSRRIWAGEDLGADRAL